jgi:6-phosphogluconolactonase (cycloisomerase 2 family)
MGKLYWVWAPDDGEKPAEANVFGVDEEDAALNFVERNFSRLNHPSECHVRVDDQVGHRFELTVTSKAEPRFRISRRY